MLVSVVISTYNRPTEILKRAVNSVLSQTYKPIELIVVNDYPQNKELSENIRVMLNEIDSGIRYIIHEKNLGACAARNSGLAVAKGEYIGFLDDDDEWLPDKIKKQMELMKDDVSIVGCDSIRISKAGAVYHHPTISATDKVSAILRTNFLGSTSFPLMKTACVRNVGGFDVNVKSCQDYDLWIRMLVNYNYDYVNEALVNCYYSEDSTFKSNNKKYIDGWFYLINKYKNLYETHPGDYLYNLNNGALNGLIYLKSLQIYFLFKKKALSYKFFCRYNFFMIPIKVLKRYLSTGEKK